MGDPRAVGIALLDRSAVSGGQGGHRSAMTDAERALEIFTDLGETWWAARAMRAVGMALFNDGHLDRGQGHLIGAITAFKGEDDRWWVARTQRNLAELRLAQRRPEEARELLEDALAVFERDRNRYSEAQTLRAYGEVLGATARGLHAAGDVRAAGEDFARAGFSLDRAAEMFRLRGELWEEARCLRAAGEVGNPANALRELTYVRRATEMLTALGDSWGVARSELSAGRAHGRLGRTREAQESLLAAVRDFEELGDRWWMARSLRYLGEAHLEAGGPAGLGLRPAAGPGHLPQPRQPGGDGPHPGTPARGGRLRAYGRERPVFRNPRAARTAGNARRTPRAGAGPGGQDSVAVSRCRAASRASSMLSWNSFLTCWACSVRCSSPGRVSASSAVSATSASYCGVRSASTWSCWVGAVDAVGLADLPGVLLQRADPPGQRELGGLQGLDVGGEGLGHLGRGRARYEPGVLGPHLRQPHQLPRDPPGLVGQGHRVVDRVEQPRPVISEARTVSVASCVRRSRSPQSSSRSSGRMNRSLCSMATRTRRRSRRFSGSSLRPRSAEKEIRTRGGDEAPGGAQARHEQQEAAIATSLTGSGRRRRGDLPQPGRAQCLRAGA
ncbi:tetratricopeptide repeat protein [Streptosporangium vulgare]|uniref:tetratricopeptide repeat protein n=1 Tax=Streptosporangium vulgare TaxID=46190 RepID=UPI0031DC2192